MLFPFLPTAVYARSGTVTASVNVSNQDQDSHDQTFGILNSHLDPDRMCGAFQALDVKGHLHSNLKAGLLTLHLVSLKLVLGSVSWSLFNAGINE